jgi:formate C-acetyltransferase
MTHARWNGFAAGPWQDEINVRDFIQRNYTPYEGDDSFLADATPRTRALMEQLQALFAEERSKWAAEAEVVYSDAFDDFTVESLFA